MKQQQESERTKLNQDTSRIAHKSPKTSQPESSVAGGSKHNSSAIVHRATGPRTVGGKKRSSRNAVKHGILSRDILVVGESRGQFESILMALTEQLHPVGAAEELLVERLVIVSLRQQRFLVAESAEIRRSIEFMAWDENLKHAQESNETFGIHTMEFKGPSSVLTPIGLMYRTQNPVIRDRCLGFLVDLRKRATENGFDRDRDSMVLATLHGGPVGLWQLFLKEMQEADNERARGGHVSSPLSKQDTLQWIDDDIRWLQILGGKQTRIETERSELKQLCLLVPESPTLDRLMRYETHLSREFDRILSRLERLQRMRLGQPGPPTVRLELDD